MAITSLRTQITLPKSLRQEIDKQRKLRGESLGEYLRQAAKDRLKKEQRRKSDLKRLALNLGNLVNRSSWEGVNIVKWQRKIRKDRQII